MPNLNAVVHCIPDAPLRTSAIRAPGKVANTFAVESFVDEIAALARVDPVEFRCAASPTRAGSRCCSGPRRAWAGSRGRRPAHPPTAAVLTGRGIAYVHYKHEETIVAMGMEVAVERATGRSG